MDALYVKTRDNGQMNNPAVFVAITKESLLRDSSTLQGREVTADRMIEQVGRTGGPTAEAD